MYIYSLIFIVLVVFLSIIFIRNVKKEKYKEIFSIFKLNNEDRKNIAKFDNMVELLKSVEKNLNVEEKGSNYEVTYSGIDDSAKESLKKAIISTQQNSEKILKNMEIEKLEIKYLIDKKTFYPTDCEIKSTVKVSQGTKEISFDMDIKANYFDINQVKEIAIPDEVKNAK